MAIDPSPAEILARVRAVYASCATYEDEGTVVTRFIHETPGRTHTDRLQFSTAFVRPDRLRLEWADEDVGPEEDWWRDLILWNVEGARSSSSLDPDIKTHDAIHDALGAAAGVSHGVSRTVSRLLLPREGKHDDLPEPEDVTGIARATIDGDDCVGVSFADWNGDAVTVWVATSDYLIRRIDEQSVMDQDRLAAMRAEIEAYDAAHPERTATLREDFQLRPHRVETTTTYRPRIDARIEPERFEAPDLWPTSCPPARSPRPPLVFAPVSPPSPGPLEILARVRRAYTACATLRDRGIATSTSIRQSGARDTDKQRFAIDFVRPDRFRVETAKMTVGPEDEWFSWWILRDGERVLLSSGSYSKDPVSPDEFVARLGRLLVIPGLLVPCPAELDPLPTNDTAALLGLMTLGAQECHVVRGTCAAGFERTLWVDTVGLVRRCDEVFHVDEAWRERMRTRTEEKLRLATPEQATEIRRSLEFFSRPSEPYSTETTVLFDPEPDAAIEAARFAVPDSRTR